MVYRGLSGIWPPVTVTVDGMILTRQPRSKEGRDVEEVSYEQVREDRVLFVLSDGYWTYSEDVDLDATDALKAPPEK